MSDYHKKYNSFYQTPEWKTVRAFAFQRANGLCEKCLEKGKIIQGVEVHHKKPIDTPQGWKRRYDIDNLICLCRECHNSAHDRTSAWSEFKNFWEELNVKDAENNP